MSALHAIAASLRSDRSRVPPALFALAAATSGVLVVAWMTRVGFLIDDWELLLGRRPLDADAIFAPHNEHIAVAPTLIYRALQELFGMESALPYALVAGALFMLSIGLTFVYVRGRLGPWLALAACLPLLFLGAAYQDLLSPFQLGYTGAAACGIGALLALDRGDRRGELIACGLLCLGLTFSSVILPFVPAIALLLVLQPGERARRLWVVAAPAVLYLAWYLGWGHEAETHLSFDNVAAAGQYLLDGVAASVSALLGLAAGDRVTDEAHALAWGQPLLVLVLIAGVIRFSRLRAVSPLLWTALALLVIFWALAGFNTTEGRAATSSRYLYVGAVLVVLVIAELFRGARPNLAVTIAALAVATLAAAPGLAHLNEGFKQLRDYSDTVRGALAGVELAGDDVDPALVLDEQNSGFNFFGYVEAGPYLSAASQYGSPAYDEAELAEHPLAGVAADRVLAAAQLPDLAPARAPEAGCRFVASEAGIGAFVTLAPGTTTFVADDEPLTVRLRRYATDEFPVQAGRVPAGSAGELTIPADDGEAQWQALVETPTGARVCANAQAEQAP